MTRHVPADRAHASRSSMVRHSYGYFSASVNPDGSLVHSGPKNGEEYLYLAPDGTRYTRRWRCNQDGSPTGIIGHSVMGPVVNGQQIKTVTIINHGDSTDSQRETKYSITRGPNAPEYLALDLWSHPSEVQQALQSGQATQQGITTVQGTPAIALSITVPGAWNLHRTLYVDARSYQPLRTVTVAHGNPSPYVADWDAGHPDNIAKAQGHTIPAG